MTQPVPLGGLGAIQDEVIATINLDQTIQSLDALLANGTLVEFGSSAFFVPGDNNVPGPSAVALFGLGLAGLKRRRRGN